MDSTILTHLCAITKPVVENFINDQNNHLIKSNKTIVYKNIALTKLKLHQTNNTIPKTLMLKHELQVEDEELKKKFSDNIMTYQQSQLKIFIISQTNLIEKLKNQLLKDQSEFKRTLYQFIETLLNNIDTETDLNMTDEPIPSFQAKRKNTNDSDSESKTNLDIIVDKYWKDSIVTIEEAMNKFNLSLNLKEWNLNKKKEQYTRNIEMALDPNLTVNTVSSLIDEKLMPIHKKVNQLKGKTVRFAATPTTKQETTFKGNYQKKKLELPFYKPDKSHFKKFISICDVNRIDYKITNLSFFNLTPPGTTLPHGLTELLGLNLKFCPTPPPTPFETFTKAGEQLKRQIRLNFQTMTWPKRNFIRSLYVKSPNFEPNRAHQAIEDELEIFCNNINKSIYYLTNR
eukprot:Awhi_evm2s10327